jgi:GNAT superfamily N-acetyltransferase
VTPNAACVIRPARRAELPALERLIAASARELSVGFYDRNQIEAAVAHVFGVDTELVDDGTYLLAEDGGRLVGCGGWSRRLTLFGGDRATSRQTGLLDPAVDAARIRAFFVAPGQARRGIAAALLARCEAAARDAAFTRLALMATLPGVPFYRRAGFAAQPAILHRCGQVEVPFVPMEKMLH